MHNGDSFQFFFDNVPDYLCMSYDEDNTLMLKNGSTKG